MDNLTKYPRSEFDKFTKFINELPSTEYDYLMSKKEYKELLCQWINSEIDTALALNKINLILSEIKQDK